LKTGRRGKEGGGQPPAHRGLRPGGRTEDRGQGSEVGGRKKKVLGDEFWALSYGREKDEKRKGTL
jgi:hypothetical protein